jgi:hypothetical protein
MGGLRNSLRHHGMIATSPGWRRHFWPARQRTVLAVRPVQDAHGFWPALFSFWASALAGVFGFWSGRAGGSR